MAEASQPPASPPPPDDRFKAEMPHIPGVSGAGATTRRASPGAIWLIAGGVAVVLVAVLLGGKLLSKPRRAGTPTTSQQVDVPTTPDLPVPQALDPDAPIAKIGDLAKPWDSRPFTFHNHITGENVPALLVRLPSGSGAQAAGYWSFAMRAAYTNCQLEYLHDLDKVRTDYGFGRATHPFVGNPCTRALYDPLKYASLPGGVLARGAVVQGSDLRPPLGVEIKIRGKEILAARME